MNLTTGLVAELMALMEEKAQLDLKPTDRAVTESTRRDSRGMWITTRHIQVPNVVLVYLTMVKHSKSSIDQTRMDRWFNAKRSQMFHAMLLASVQT